MPGKIYYIPQKRASKDFWGQFAKNNDFNDSSVSYEQLNRVKEKLGRVLNKPASLVIPPRDLEMINKILLNSRRP